jgi:hypothetical protein
MILPPLPPLPPNASAEEKMRHLVLQKQRNDDNNWDLAINIVLASVCMLFVAGGVLFVVYKNAGLPGTLSLIVAGLALWLAVVELHKRL